MMWPDGVPRSLWNYDRSVAGPSSSQILPLSNYTISGEFVLYFLIGLVVVWLYAWNRFNRRTYDPAPFDYQVLRELQPAQMRDSLLMQRAFMLYALVLSLIYATFTFFGGLILRITSTFPVAGPVDVDPQTLQSPQWPLMLAFGLAGLTQLIGPLDHLEKTLRSHIHRSLGIPIRIKEYTRLLISRQLVDIAAEAQRSVVQDHASPRPAAGPVETAIAVISKGRVTHLQKWARDEIAQTFGVENVLTRLVLLWRMIDSLHSPDWPQESVRDEMRSLLSRQIPEARATARYLSDLLESAPVREHDDSQAADEAQDAVHAPLRTRQEQQLITAIESMERHLYEIGAIHAVYAQRDRNYDSIPDRHLRAAVTTLFREEGYGPSLAQLASCMSVIFIGYFAALSLTSQGLMAAMPRNVWTVGLSATYETVRTLCIYVFPLLFAIYVTTPERGRDARVGSAAGQAMAAFLWSGIVSLVLLALLAMLYTWLVALNSSQFSDMLLGRFNTAGPLPNLAWFMSFAPISALVAAGVSLARQLPSDRLHYLAMTIVAVLAAILSKLHELTVSRSAAWCWDNAPECLATNFADMVFAFVAVMFLCQSRAAGRIALDRRAPMVPWAAGGTAAGLALLAWFFAVAPAGAQAPDPQPVAAPVARQVVLGFRGDAEPFSYLNRSGGQPRFQGYIVDLCYEIFAGSSYEIISVTVEVDDRFARLRPGLPGARQPLIDVLCDPVTIRYEQTDRWTNGIFSPVIFASSVIYLRRDFGATNPSEHFGFVRGTTAETVAREICRSSNAPRDAKLCDAEALPAECTARADPRPAPIPAAGGFADRFMGRLLLQPRREVAGPTYVACPQDSHGALIAWFCEDGVPARRYYIGDRELITGKWRSWQARNGPCAAEVNSTPYTYEPYALLVTKSDPDLVQFVQRRVYQIFSDSSKARALLAASFPDTQMSSSLAYLFLLNGVDEERAIKQADCTDRTSPCLRGQVSDDPAR